MRNSLVTALVSCADTPLRLEARRFLRGLSSDELQFIAEYFGACILDEPLANAGNRAEMAARIADFRRARGDAMRDADMDHKMILLLEYLCSVRIPIAA